VDGAQVLLNSPGNANDSVESDDAQPTTIVLTDQENNPIANHSFCIRSGGREISGATDGEGRAVLDLEDGGEIEFGGLQDVEVG
jgi:hypothetical protein